MDAAGLLADCLRDGVGTRTDHRRALTYHAIAAKAGSAEAHLSLGYAHFYGLGTRRSPAEALRWYRRAARRGSSHAMINIGLMYQAGTGVARDPAKAKRWFAKAAALGNAPRTPGAGAARAPEKK